MLQNRLVTMNKYLFFLVNIRYYLFNRYHISHVLIKNHILYSLFNLHEIKLLVLIHYSRSPISVGSTSMIQPEV